jgi:hypothetical protein
MVRPPSGQIMTVRVRSTYRPRQVVSFSRAASTFAAPDTAQREPHGFDNSKHPRVASHWNETYLTNKKD